MRKRRQFGQAGSFYESDDSTHGAGGRPRRGLRPALDSLEPRCLLTSISEYPVLVSAGHPGDAKQLTLGLNGNIWFTEPTANEIGIFNPTNQSVSQESLSGTIGADPPGITATGTGSNAAIWFTLSAVGQFGMLNPNNIASAPKIFNGAGELPGGAGIISIGTDLWFAMPSSNALGMFNFSTPTTSSVTPYSLSPENINVANFESQITPGPDNTIWFTEPGAIGIFSLNSDTVIGKVSLPTSGGTQMPTAIAAGPNNTMWFTESVPNSGGTGFVSSAVGVINANSPPSYVEEFALPAASQPSGITEGPDGNIWFTETGTGDIGFVNVAGLSSPSQYTLGPALPIPTTGETGGVLGNPAPVGIIATATNLWFADESGAIGEVNLTHFVVTVEPPSSVGAGGAFDLTVTAENGSGAVDTSFNGSVTVSLADNPGSASTSLGGPNLTLTAGNGTRMFSNLTIDTLGSQYTIQATSSASDAPTVGVTSDVNVVPGTVTKLVVTAQPPLSVPAGQGFSLTVTAEDQFNDIATNFNGSVSISLPASNPGGSGTILSGMTNLPISSTSGTPGSVTFTGLSLNNPGTGYTLLASISPTVTTSTKGFDVTNVVPPPPPPPSPPTITGESVMLKLNKKTHKPVKPNVVLGYMITFDTAMDQMALSNSSNFVIDIEKLLPVKGKKGKKTLQLVQVGSHVSQVTSSSVLVTPNGKQTFPKGGQLTVEAAGLDDTSGVFLAAPGVFTISKGGKQIN